MIRLIGVTLKAASILRYIKIHTAIIIFSISTYSIALSVERVNVNAMLSSSDSLYQKFDYRGPAAYFSQAADLDSSSFNAFWKLSRSMNFIGELAIAIRPAYINHHLEMGITFQEYDKKELAREEFEICLSLSPEGPLDNLYKEEARKHLAKIIGD